MKISHQNLPLFSQLIDICTPFNLNKGTVTAFVNYCLSSPFIPTQDETFALYVRSIGEEITSRANRVNNKGSNSTYEFYEKIQDPTYKRRFVFSTGPSNRLETYATSYEGMQAVIQLTCQLLQIEDDASYYKDPYILYNKIDDRVDNYIEQVAFPTLEKYLQTFDLNKKIKHAIENNQDLEIDFYPEKLHILFDNYLYAGEKHTYAQLVHDILNNLE